MDPVIAILGAYTTASVAGVIVSLAFAIRTAYRREMAAARARSRSSIQPRLLSAQHAIGGFF
jgi:hypothetical protein